MAKILKQAKANKFSVEYHVDLWDEENGRFLTYANNSHFNWGHVGIFDTREEAEKDFNDFLGLLSYNWKVEAK